MPVVIEPVSLTPVPLPVFGGMGAGMAGVAGGGTFVGVAVGGTMVGVAVGFTGVGVGVGGAGAGFDADGDGDHRRLPTSPMNVVAPVSRFTR